MCNISLKFINMTFKTELQKLILCCSERPSVKWGRRGDALELDADLGLHDVAQQPLQHFCLQLQLLAIFECKISL